MGDLLIVSPEAVGDGTIHPSSIPLLRVLFWAQSAMVKTLGTLTKFPSDIMLQISTGSGAARCAGDATGDCARTRVHVNGLHKWLVGWPVGKFTICELKMSTLHARCALSVGNLGWVSKWVHFMLGALLHVSIRLRSLSAK